MIDMIKTPMADLRREARYSLAKHGLEADGRGGVKVRLVLDHSGSMKPWYRAGAVQRLTEQVLGLAAALDDDGTIEVWYFGDYVSDVYTVSLNPNSPAYYAGWVDKTHRSQRWGMTNYVAPIRATAKYRRDYAETEPSLVIFQTDGGPNNRSAANEALRAVSGDEVFYAFTVFGEEDSDAADYMRSLDNLSGRVRDNASAYVVGGLATYASVPDGVVYDGVLGEFVGQWLPQVL
jgi:hypothetical protein